MRVGLRGGRAGGPVPAGQLPRAATCTGPYDVTGIIGNVVIVN